MKLNPLSQLTRSPFSKANGFTARRRRLSGFDNFGMQSPEGVPLRLPGHWHVAYCNGTTRRIVDRTAILFQGGYEFLGNEMKHRGSVT